MRGMRRAGDLLRVCKHGCDVSLSLRLHPFIRVSLLKFIDTDLCSPQAFPEKTNTGHVLRLLVRFILARFEDTGKRRSGGLHLRTCIPRFSCGIAGGE